MRGAWLLLPLLVSPQDADSLVETLRTGTLEERDAAEQKLLDLGEKAEPALRNAVAGSDNELKARAQDVLTVLDVRRRLGPELLKHAPGADREIAAKRRRFFDLLDDNSVTRRLRRDALERLASEAFREALGPDELEELIDLVSRHYLGGQWKALVDIADRAKGPDKFAARAATTLERLRCTEALPASRRFLAHKEPQVRRSALSLLASHGDREALPLIHEMVADAEVGDRAVEALVTIDPDGLKRRLPDLLLPHSGRVAAAAAEAVQQLDAVEFVPRLIDLVRGPDVACATRVARTLQSMGRREALPALLELLCRKSGDRYEIYSATRRMFEESRDADSWKLILPLFDNPDADLRETAIDLLYAIDAYPAARRIVELANDPSPVVRAKVAYSLPGIDPIGFRRVMKKLASDPDAKVRRSTMEEITNIWTPEARELALAGLEDPDEGVRRLALDAVAALGNAGDAAVVAKCLEFDGMRAGMTLLALHDGSRAGLLVDLFAGGVDRNTRISTEDMLLELPERDLAAALLERLRNPESPSFVRSASLACELRLEAARPLLREALASKVATARLAALGALIDFGEREIVTALLRDPDDAVRLEAMRGVRRFHLDAVAQLLPLLDDPKCRRLAAEVIDGLTHDPPAAAQAAVAELPHRRYDGVKDDSQIEPAIRDCGEYDAAIREGAARYLSRVARRDHLPALLEGADQSRHDELKRVVAGMDEKDAAPAVADHARVSRVAAKIYAASRWPSATSSLVRLLVEDPLGSRSEIAEVLAGRDGCDAEIEALLTSRDADIRRNAACILVFRDPERAWPVVRPLAKDPDAGVRAGLADAVGMVRLLSARDEVLAMLRDPHAAVTRAAVVAAGRLRLPDAAPDVLRLLKTGMEEAVDAARILRLRDALPDLARLAMIRPSRASWLCSAMGSIGDPAAKAPLVELARRQPLCLQSACQALAELEGTDELLGLLKDDCLEVRRRAAIALGATRNEQHAPVLALLDDMPGFVVRGALDYAGDRRVGEAVPRLKDIAGHSRPFDDRGDNFVTRSGVALRSLGRIGTPEAVRAIVGFIDSLDGDLRRRSIVALGETRSAEAVPALRARLACARDREDALRALVRIGAADAEEDFVRALDSTRSAERRLGCRGLARIGAKHRADRIAELLDDRDAEAADEARDALVRLGETKHYARIAAVRLTALVRARRREGADLFLARLETRAPFALEALARLGDRRILPHLPRMAHQLSDPGLLSGLVEADRLAKLSETRANVDVHGTLEQFAAWFEKRSGFRVHVPDAIARERVAIRYDDLPLSDLLVAALPEGWSWRIDGNAVRLATRAEVLDYWRKWKP
jgi:HEAT repeat protein